MKQPGRWRRGERGKDNGLQRIRAGVYSQRSSAVKYIALFLIRLYQRTLSVALPSSCRFTPSCSQYGYEAIQRFGFFRGGWMTAMRIGRCHPFYRGNLYDPVPERVPTGSRKAGETRG